MSVKIIKVTTALPPFSRKTEDILPFVDLWLDGKDDRFIRKAKKIFEGALVDERYSIMSPEQVFSKMTFEERNKMYSDAAIEMGETVLRQALNEANWQPKDLDFIITVSCTGIMIPSLDAYLINILGLKQDIVRLPVTEMGCVGGISGLIYAKNFLKANPNKKAAIIAYESPTATFQWDDHSMANIVSAAIFGDGAACVLLSSDPEDVGPEIIAESMYHFYDQEHMMGFKLVNSGLQMVLDVEVPDTIATHFPNFIYPFLDENNCKIEDLNHLIFHPGGKKIVNTVEEIFLKLGKNINDTKEVLRLYGNMSSATVLFVLKRIMAQDVQKGDKGLMLSFGPGFTAQRILLSW
jgi:predicted naringenin-chalcone synthase